MEITIDNFNEVKLPDGNYKGKWSGWNIEITEGEHTGYTFRSNVYKFRSTIGTKVKVNVVVINGRAWYGLGLIP